VNLQQLATYPSRDRLPSYCRAIPLPSSLVFFVYSYHKVILNFFYRSAAICLSYVVYYARCSTVSSVSTCNS